MMLMDKWGAVQAGARQDAEVHVQDGPDIMGVNPVERE